jgi:hypothetical protein
MLVQVIFHGKSYQKIQQNPKNLGFSAIAENRFSFYIET